MKLKCPVPVFKKKDHSVSPIHFQFYVIFIWPLKIVLRCLTEPKALTFWDTHRDFKKLHRDLKKLHRDFKSLKINRPVPYPACGHGDGVLFPSRAVTLMLHLSLL